MLTPQLRRIYQLPGLTTPTQLTGAYGVWDVPLGPVAGAYQTVRSTPEDLAAYLQSQGLLGASVGLKPLSLATAQQLLQNAPTSLQVNGGVFYAITGPWNAAAVSTVFVFGLPGNVFASTGWVVDSGVVQAVEVDVAAGTWVVAGGGPALPTIDLLDLTTAQMLEVMGLAYTDCDADPADSPAWSRPGHQFDAYDAQGRNCHFYCTRGTFDPTAPAGTTGVGPAWHYFLKLG